MFIKEAMPPVSSRLCPAGDICALMPRGPELVVGVCGTRQAEEVPGRTATALAGVGSAGRLARERWPGGVPIVASFSLLYPT
ncbi:hypothetical protein ACVIDN_006055 [Rhizobium brockwellii]